MKTMKIFATALLLIAVAIGCKKEEEVLESIQSAEDNAMIETEFSAVFEVTDDVVAVTGSAKGTESFKSPIYTVLPSGAEVIFTDSLWNDGNGIAFYIDFGPLGNVPPKGLLCKDGRYRAGRIDASLSAPYFEVNSLLTISVLQSNDYFAGDGTNMTHLSGVKTVTRTDENTRQIVVTGAQATNENGTVYWSAERTVTKTFDNGSGIWGDHFSLYGTATGTNLNSIGFTATVTSGNPLIKKLETGCAGTFVAGVVTIENTAGGKLELDYDPYNNEACDKVASVTINGKTKIIFVR